ncbi:MAG: AAA family ATPase [Paludibacteraceae bacterium]|nr:AAA family ATPase [Paludibacteraceae bacterium]
MTYRGKEINDDCYKKIANTLGLNNDSAWFVHEINILNQDELHFTAYMLGEQTMTYSSTEERKNAFLSKLPKDGKKIYVGESNSHKASLQQIYYGAPGTGKSHTIKDQTAEANKSGHVIRTTFHPDSDYSTFVGCYKPTTIEVPMRDVTGKVIRENGEDVTETRIVYEFVRQAFLEAYVNAWKLYAEAQEGEQPQTQYLIIEEINRGNCAQIFGDLFQLLDRNGTGFSDYPIKADNDLKKQLAKAFKGLSIIKKEEINAQYNGKDVVEKVLNGEELLLPNNLYIWATMNTSDQSLFPIDSAFKRRWDWKYVPISNAEKNWSIEVNGKQYDWWDFLEKINEKIGEATNSEDKKLGYFFCKADPEGIISAEKFAGKVIFYLWNDVFKDFIEEAGDMFNDTDGAKLSFQKFYTVVDNETKVVEAKVEKLLTNLGVNVVGDGTKTTEEETPILDEDGNDTNATSKRNFDYTKYSVNGEGRYPKTTVAQHAIQEYVSMHPNMSPEDVVKTWTALNVAVSNLVETEQMYRERTSGSTDKNLSTRYKTIQMSNGEILYVSNQYNVGNITELMNEVNKQNWGITIEKIDEQA